MGQQVFNLRRAITTAPALGNGDRADEVPAVRAGALGKLTLDDIFAALVAADIPDLSGTYDLAGAAAAVLAAAVLKANNLADLPNAATARGNLGLGTLAVFNSPLPVANGGSGTNTANGALNAFLPAQAGQNNKALVTDGNNTSWVLVGGVGVGDSPSWTGIHTFIPAARAAGVVPFFRIATPADTGQTASTESIGLAFGGTNANPPLTVTRTWATGALATQRENLFTAPTYAFAGASTLTTAATVAISGAPAAGANATITNSYALLVQSGVTFLNGHLYFTDNSYDIGSGSNRIRNLYVGNSAQLQEIICASTIQAGSQYEIRWNGRSAMKSLTNGNITLTNAASNDFFQVQLGGTTSSFPSLKRSGTLIQARLADDTADSDLSARWMRNVGGRKVLTADVTNDSAVLATTGLTVSVEAGRKYSFLAYLNVTTAAVLEGVKAALAGTATITNLIADIEVKSHAGTPVFTLGRVTAFNEAVGQTVADVGNATVEIEGTLEVNAAGILRIDFAKNADTGALNTTIKRGSYFLVEDMP